MPLRAVVIEDEPYARADLVRLLESLDVQVIAQVDDGARALRVLSQVAPDVVFLDISLPGLTGLELAERQGLPPIVFVTAHPDHAPRAFDLDVCDYLVKPVTRDRLARSLDRVLRHVIVEEDSARSNVRLKVTDSRGTRYIDARKIEFFTAADKYVSFRVDGEEHLLRGSLDDLETRFGQFGFVRAHRAHLVQVAAVQRAEDGEQGLVLVFQSGRRIPVSKRHRSAVRRALD